MGVSWEQFWNMNPRILKSVTEGYAARIKFEAERANIQAHLQGQYFVDGILATVGNMFSKGNSYKYPKKPYDLHSEKENNSQEEIAVFEMKQRTNSLKKLGLQDSPK